MIWRLRYAARMGLVVNRGEPVPEERVRRAFGAETDESFAVEQSMIPFRENNGAERDTGHKASSGDRRRGLQLKALGTRDNLPSVFPATISFRFARRR